MSLSNITTLVLYDKHNTAASINTTALSNCFNELKLTKPVCFVLMSDDELLEVNRQALNHDYYTDVITFDYTDDIDMELNEILISVDRVIENARNNEVPVANELHRVCIHGMLHIAGHKDDTLESKEEMTRLENRHLALHCST